MNKERALLLTLAVIQFSHITDFMILMPLGPTLMRAFDILPSQFALLVSAYTFSAGIFGFVGAFFIDRFDRKKMLIIMATGFALGTLACGFSSSYYMLLFTRAFTGSFGGILSALILSIIGDVVPNERRAGAMGLVMASFSLASVVGVPLGLYLATMADWHFPFMSLGVIALLTLIPIMKFIPTMNSHIVSRNERDSPIAIIRNVLDNKNQLYALLFGIVIMFSHFSVVPFISPYLVTNVGFSEKDITYIYLIGGGLTIFTAPLIGRLADRFGRLKVFVIAVIVVSFPIFFLTNLTEQPIAIVLLITSVFFVFGSGRMIPSTAMITSSVRPKNRGSFMSFNAACRQLTNGFAAYFGGLIITQGEDGLLHHYDWVGYIAIGMGILSIIIARKIKVVDETGFEN
jgi:predicted MFS family arabinose efflux permease